MAEFVRRLPLDPRAERRAILDALTANPGNFTLNRLLLDRAVYQRAPARDRYRREFEADPENIDRLYLHARSLVGKDTPAALKLYAQMLERDSEYPWVHLSQLEIYRAEAFRDRKKLQASFETIRRVCPSAPEPYRYLGEIEDTALVTREATQLRQHLAKSEDVRWMRIYPVLWSTEFRVRPKEEHDAVRRTVAEDLTRLWRLESVPEIHAAMTNGARLTGNNALIKEIAENRPRPLMEQYREWAKTHPIPKPDDPPDKKRAGAQMRLNASTKWIAIAPEEPLGYAERLRALVTIEAPETELGRAGDDLLAANRGRTPGPLSYFLSVAKAYLDRGLLLDRVPAIIEEARRSFDDEESIIEIDLAPDPSITARNRMMNVAFHSSSSVLLSELYEKQGQADRARDVLRALEQYLSAKAPPEGEKDEVILAQYRAARFNYWFRLASFSEHEGRKLDALQAYREAAAASAPTEAVLAPQRRLWKELGGSDEAWARWISTQPVAAPKSAGSPQIAFAAMNRPLPEFSLNDVAGGVWTLSRFEGKTTIATVWATWCLPCLEELPYFARIAEKLKQRPDVQVISLNIDDNSGLVEPFLKQHGYTFPVLLARNLATDLMPSFAIPRTWIIRDGVLAAESIGFGGDREKWVEAVVSQLQ